MFVLNISMNNNKIMDVLLVNLVHIGVKIVKLLIFVVMNVLVQTELLIHVSAKMVTMMEDIQIAYHVTGDVKHVLITQKIVSYVKT